MSRYRYLEMEQPKVVDVALVGEPVMDEDHFLRLADEQLAEGGYEMALRYYSRVLSLDGHIERAWVGQLLCLMELGECEEALTWSDRALQNFPESGLVLAMKGVAWCRLGDQQKARGFSDSSIKTGGDRARVWWARGEVIIADSLPNADYCFNKALEMDSLDWGLFLRIGKTYLALGQPVKARDVLLRARQMARERPLVWFWLGVAQQKLGDNRAAEQCFNRAVELRPRDKAFQQALDDLYRQGPLLGAVNRVKSWFR